MGSECDKKSGIGDLGPGCPCPACLGIAVVCLGVASLSDHLTSTITCCLTLSMSQPGQPNWNRPQHPSKHPQRVDEPPASHRAYPGPAGVGLIDEQLANIRSQFEHILQQNHILKAANDELEVKRACDTAQ